MGGLLIIYTMSGGAKAVAYTQQLQLAYYFHRNVPGCLYGGEYVSQKCRFYRCIAGKRKTGKIECDYNWDDKKGTIAIFDWSDQYNLLSGIIGGFFLGLILFRNRSITGGKISDRQICYRKPDGFADEWVCKSADAISDLADRCIGFYFLSIQ